MSVLDQFRTAEQQVAKRLRELKPLVTEYHELQHVAQRLGLNVNDDANGTERRPPASSKSTRPRTSPTKARSAASTRDESGNGASPTTPGATTPARRARSPRTTPDNGRAGSKRTSRREQDVLRLVNERPGVTVSEIAKQLGVDATGLYRPVHKLEQQGAITKQGAALQPTNP
ncbi:MAG TPA: helix-turn-helix domain-containing protein [Baekduia sp.]|nr:helix-turn-helix domain-containing protein [Baekduia sp.]